MPLHIAGIEDLPPPDGRAFLDTMPGTDIPVIRQPYAAGDRLPFWAGHGHVDQHHLYDLDGDPDEAENRTGEAVEADLIDLLHSALDEVEAPTDQLERLGLN